MFSKKKALSDQRNLIIIAVVIIAIIGIYWFTRPSPPPTDGDGDGDGNGGPPPENKLPVPISASDQTSVLPGESVSFSAQGSVDPDGTIEEYIWYFGDGETGTGNTVSHSYDLPGYYIIYLEVTDNSGDSADTLQTPMFLKVERDPIADLSLDLPPVALIGTSESILEPGSEITLSGAASYHYRERSGEIQSYVPPVDSWSWELGDGTTADEKEVMHSFDSEGSYLVKLTVGNTNNEKTDTVGRTVIVSETSVDYSGIIKNPDTLMMAMGAPAAFEIMEISEGNVGRWVCLATTDTLLKYLPGSTEPSTEGGLADTYEVSTDGLTYTFNLKKGIKFWDGKELTAEDVVYTFRREFKRSAGQSWGALLREVATGVALDEVIPDSVLEEHVYAEDEYTVVFKVTRPYGPFLFSMAYPGRGIIQKEAAIEAGSWFMGDTREWTGVPDPAFEDLEGVLAGEGFIGSGPYFPIEWSKTDRVTFERFDDYWYGVAPNKYVYSLNVPEWSTKFLLLMQGDIDCMSPASPAQAEQVINLPVSAQTYVTPIKFEGFIEVCYFGFNFDETVAPPGNNVPNDFFNDVHMRKAFSYAVPYEQYVQEVYLGWADPAKGILIPGWPGYYKSFPFEYDLEKAEEEFKLAHDGKYWDEGFEVVYAYQAWAEDTGGALGRLIEASVREINPNFKVVPTVTTWGDLVGGGTPFGTMVAENGPDAYYITNVMSGGYGYAGKFGYQNEEVDELLVAAQAETDPVLREELYVEAQQIIEEEVPGILTVYTPAFFAAKNYVTGFQYNVGWITDPGWIYTLEKTP
ncbi:ABC transporter substrate-binding protein [Thermoproteota archaeon]